MYEDPHLLAVAKPAGVPTQSTAAGEPGVDAAIRLRLAADPRSAVYLGTVHRLDRPVSGVLLWAKTPKAARRLSEQFAAREAKKAYWALVEGSPPAESGAWSDLLARDDSAPGRYARVCGPGTPKAQSAITHYRVLDGARSPAGLTLLELLPETGRTHQLRVQAAHRGLPILGDRVYGAAGSFPEGIALHARSLEVRHPVSGVPLAFRTPPPPAWGVAWVEAAWGAD